MIKSGEGRASRFNPATLSDQRAGADEWPQPRDTFVTRNGVNRWGLALGGRSRSCGLTSRTQVLTAGARLAQAGCVAVGLSAGRLKIGWCGEIAQVAECGEMGPTRSRSGVPLALPQCSVPRSLPRWLHPASGRILADACRSCCGCRNCRVQPGSSAEGPRCCQPRWWGLLPDQGNL